MHDIAAHTTTDVGVRILDALELVIAGQRGQLELAMATLLSGGHLLLEDRPGVGKTALAKAIGRVLDIPTGRIQGTADLLPTDVTGVHVFQPHVEAWTFRPGPIFTSLLLVDELNRATPKAQAALLEAMAEGQVTVDGETRTLGHPFMVIATQNPQGEVGTYPLGQAQVDRFAAMLHLGLPGRQAEREVLEGTAGVGRPRGRHPGGGRARARHALRARRDHDGLCRHRDLRPRLRRRRPRHRPVDLVERAGERDRPVGGPTAGPSCSDRDYVAPEDVQAVLPAVLAHRLPRGFELTGVQATLGNVPVPVDAR